MRHVRLVPRSKSERGQDWALELSDDRVVVRDDRGAALVDLTRLGALSEFRLPGFWAGVRRLTVCIGTGRYEEVDVAPADLAAVRRYFEETAVAGGPRVVWTYLRYALILVALSVPCLLVAAAAGNVAYHNEAERRPGATRAPIYFAAFGAVAGLALLGRGASYAGQYFRLSGLARARADDDDDAGIRRERPTRGNP